MLQFAKLFLEPFPNRLFVYGQYQFAVIGWIPFHFENIVLDVKLPFVFFRINPVVASDSLFLCQEALYHFFGKADDSAQLFHSQHLPEHRKPFERFFNNKSQTQKVRDKIIKILDIIEQVERIPSTYLKYIEGTNGLFEVRIQLGSNIFRIFCFFDGNKFVILLTGFQKKTQKTPPKEIDRAVRLMNEYYEEKRKEMGK